MPYRGSRNEAVDDFDVYDPTPYSGGYDITLTYGRPLQPSVEICYPVSGSENLDFDRPQCPSGSQTSAHAYNPIREGDCYGILRPGLLPRPPPATNTGYPGFGYQTYGAQDIGYGSGNYGTGYDVRPQHQEYGSEYQSGYGRPEGSFGYGSGGYPRGDEEGSGRQGYIGGGYRRHGDGVYEGNSSYERPNYYGNLGYGEEGSERYEKPSYTNEEQRVGYKKPSYYGAGEGEEYGSSKYGNDSNEERKQHHQKHHHRHH